MAVGVGLQQPHQPPPVGFGQVQQGFGQALQIGLCRNCAAFRATGGFCFDVTACSFRGYVFQFYSPRGYWLPEAESMATVRVGLAKPAGIKLQHSLGGLGPHDPAAGGAATFRSLTLTSRSSLFFSKLSIDRNTENIQGPRSVVAVHPSCISTGGQSPVVARASNAGGRDAARPSMTLVWSWIWRATLCGGRASKLYINCRAKPRRGPCIQCRRTRPQRVPPSDDATGGRSSRWLRSEVEFSKRQLSAVLLKFFSNFTHRTVARPGGATGWGRAWV